jgi:hypothetical protein
LANITDPAAEGQPSQSLIVVSIKVFSEQVEKANLVATEVTGTMKFTSPDGFPMKLPIPGPLFAVIVEPQEIVL